MFTALFSLWNSLYCWENFLSVSGRVHGTSILSTSASIHQLGGQRTFNEVGRPIKDRSGCKTTHSSRCCQLVLWRSSILLTVSRRFRSRLDSAACGGIMVGGAACADVCGLDMVAVDVEE